jgi:LacI family repressor for deo operon, udp, cdd, tsx, nupC, and nupG
MTITGSTSARDRATIEDVAVAAGVSVATVSRALRGLPNVAWSTRERVSRVADELRYRADPSASRLATGRSRSIAIAVPLLNGWYFSQVLAGAEAVCAEAGYVLVVMCVADRAGRRGLVDATTSIDRRVDGIVFVDIPLHGDDLGTIAQTGLRTVTIGQSTDLFPSVGIDDVAVGELATEHLLELGHRRIGVIGGQAEDQINFVVPQLRQRGVERALATAGVAPDASLQVGGSFSVAGGREAMTVLMQAPEPPTAVFAMSDEMAFGAILAARESACHVPDDVSIVGVDDHDVAVVLGLTTVRQRVSEVGARAARLVLDQLEGVEVPIGRYESPIELVVRETSRKPRRRP